LEVRRVLSGVRRQVLHLDATVLFGDEREEMAQLAHLSQPAENHNGPKGPLGPLPRDRSRLDFVRRQVSRWTTDRRVEWEERAAIMEHDAGLSRDDAELRAWEALQVPNA
jgi:hypothetical protein